MGTSLPFLAQQRLLLRGIYAALPKYPSLISSCLSQFKQNIIDFRFFFMATVTPAFLKKIVMLMKKIQFFICSHTPSFMLCD